jgi:hypothetical protein
MAEERRTVRAGARPRLPVEAARSLTSLVVGVTRAAVTTIEPDAPTPVTTVTLVAVTILTLVAVTIVTLVAVTIVTLVAVLLLAGSSPLVGRGVGRLGRQRHTGRSGGRSRHGRESKHPAHGELHSFG